MENYFLIVYSGEDKKPKLRLLTEDGVSPEMPAEQAPYFQKKQIQLRHGDTCFYTFHPLGAKKDELSFRQISPAGILGTVNGLPAWRLFEDIDSECAASIYESRVEETIRTAYIERQVNRLH